MNAPQPPENQQFGGYPQQEQAPADATQVVPGGGQPQAANPNPDATQVVSPGQVPAAPQPNADATQVVSPGQVPPSSGGFPAQGPGSGGFPAQQPPQYGAQPGQQPPAYGQPPQGATPYGAPQSNPYGQPQQQPQQPYGQQQPQYGQPQQPYGAPQGSPYGQPQGNPYAQPGYGAQMFPPPPTGYAEWGQRVVGYLIDVAAPLVVVWILAFVLGITSASNPDLALVFGLIALVLWLALAGFNIWNLIIKQGTTGQSIGKKIAKIKLVSEETQQPLGPGTTFIRALCHVVDGVPCGAGFLAPLWEPKKQTWADKIMKTMVVNAPESASPYGTGGYPQQPGTGGYPQQQGGYGQPPQQGGYGQPQQW